MLNHQTPVRQDHDHHKWSTVAITVAALLFFSWFLSQGVSQLVGAALFIAVGAVLVFLRPGIAVIATFIYLSLLGDIRRFVSHEAGATFQDPLLVVAPAIIGMLFAKLLFERKLHPDTMIAKLVTALMVIMALEMVNPLQGGIMVGVAGALFYLVPLLWFWVGRSIPSHGISRLLTKVVIPALAGSAALLGLYQTFVGWLPFEAAWIRQQVANGFAALVINGSVVRAFSFFTSPAEYAGFLGFALVCCAAPLVAGRLRVISLLIPLLAWAMVLESVRSSIVLAVLALLGMWSLIGQDAQQMMTRAFLAIVIGGGALYFGMHRLQESSGGSDRIQTLYGHTAEGLLNPGESSAEGHGSIALAGIGAGLKNPVGEGLGATTMGAQKFGAHGGSGYENDVANMFASLGAFGGLLYVAIIILVLYTAYSNWRESRSLLTLTVFGVLISQLGYWLEGGHYSLAAVCWFLVGVADRDSVPLALPVRQPVPPRRIYAHPAGHA